MSDTPRTDLMVCANSGDVVPAEFARQLERELNEALRCKHHSRYGEFKNMEYRSWCAQCGKVLTQPGVAYGINPEALCICR